MQTPRRHRKYDEHPVRDWTGCIVGALLQFVVLILRWVYDC